MKTHIPFGHVIGETTLDDYDFTDLQNDPRFTLGFDQKDKPQFKELAKKYERTTPIELIEETQRILENYPDLKELIECSFNLFIYDIYGWDYKCKVTTSWITTLTEGDRVHPHNHNNCFYSGILYFGEYYDNKTNLVLLNPLSQTMRYLLPNNDLGDGRKGNVQIDDYELSAFTGAMYFWPSQIWHATMPLPHDKVRKSLAFNFVPTANLYAGDSSLYTEWITNQNL
tara:strand:- start:1767 stop:2447 length:681 start_codon:yes stop_codon:yes gene_type:complete